MTRKMGGISRSLLSGGLLLVPLYAGCSQEVGEPTDSVTQVVHETGVFELDGNAENEPGGGADWDNVIANGGGSDATTGLLTDPPRTSIFTTGGSKDILDVSEWRHKDGSVPPKDNLLHAFAASYTINGDQVVYFGSDRFAVNGDAQMGFWFLQDEVSLDSDGTFNGVHLDGDVLVHTDFTNGGKVATIAVYEWLSAGGGTDGNLNLVASGEIVGDEALTDVFCVDDNICATINSEDEDSPWPFQSKFADPDIFPPGAFMEGGINLTEIFGETKCFATFLAETRASQEENSVLKDFIMSPFDTCEPPKKPCPPKDHPKDYAKY